MFSLSYALRRSMQGMRDSWLFGDRMQSESDYRWDDDRSLKYYMFQSFMTNTEFRDSRLFALFGYNIDIEK